MNDILEMKRFILSKNQVLPLKRTKLPLLRSTDFIPFLVRG